jgi:hypothetical protein
VKQCDWCNNYFSPAVSYQVYCNSSCREEATKEKITERHKQVKRQKRQKKDRLCLGKCGTRLSIYNDHKWCDNCYINEKEVNRKIKQIRVMMHDYENNT